MENNNITEAYLEDVMSISPAGYMKGAIAVFENVTALPIGPYPIRLNISLMLCCVGGSSEIEINLRKYTVTEGDIVLIQPRQVVQILSRVDLKCFAIAVSHDFMEKVAPIREKLMNVFLRVADTPVIRIKPEEMEEMNSYYEFILKRINMTDNPNKTEIIHGLTYSTLFYLGSIVTKYIPLEPKKISRKEEILKDFLRLLNDNYYNQKSVSFYADKLFINPKHLTNVVRELTGKTAGMWIDEYVILEAKMLLKNSNLTVCQIAQKLNFANQSFFGKYFKQHVGMSPAVYRNKEY